MLLNNIVHKSGKPRHFESSSPEVLNTVVSNTLATELGVTGVSDFWFDNAELKPGPKQDKVVNTNVVK